MLKKLRKMLKKQEGFTLVELMIVVVILGILAGIGVQQYGNIQQRAKDAADAANRKVLTNATNMMLMLDRISEEDFTDTDDDDNAMLTIRRTDDPNKLVPDYLQEWPDNPMDDGEYVVEVTEIKTETGDIMYSIKVTTVVPSEPGD